MDTVLEAVRVGKQVSSPEGMLAILSDVSFAIARGETVAVMGASGAGKSTLLALLAGLDEPTSGKVCLADRELTSLDEDGRAAVRARHVGFVFQSFHLVPSLTAVENVMLPLELAGRRDARSAALEVLGRVGLAERVGHYPRQLSGGEQQRVAIARALMSDPLLLLADEPTGDLDSELALDVLRLLSEINTKGTTIIVATHDSNLVRDLGRRIILLKGGRIVEDHP